MGSFSQDNEYVNTPQGIFTASGLWFHTTEPLLKQYAGQVFEHVTLKDLVRQSALWVRLPETIAIITLPVWLWFVGPWAAVLFAVGAYLLMLLAGPGLTHPAVSPLLNWLDHAVVQAACYAAVLSVFAVSGEFVQVVIGLMGFIVLRWGLLRRGAVPLARPIQQRYYAPSVPDHILHALLHHTALRHDVALPATDRIKRDVYARRYSRAND